MHIQGEILDLKKFDAVSTKTDEEIAQENLRAKVKIARINMSIM